ncbi:hypothetical protein GCM10009872_03550 [Actinopolymorpha rutila]
MAGGVLLRTPYVDHRVAGRPQRPRRREVDLLRRRWDRRHPVIISLLSRHWILRLADPRANSVTGQVLTIDGGHELTRFLEAGGRARGPYGGLAP